LKFFLANTSSDKQNVRYSEAVYLPVKNPQGGPEDQGDLDPKGTCAIKELLLEQLSKAVAARAAAARAQAQGLLARSAAAGSMGATSSESRQDREVSEVTVEYSEAALEDHILRHGC
jgi:hypothetical protein